MKYINHKSKNFRGSKRESLNKYILIMNNNPYVTLPVAHLNQPAMSVT